MTRATELFAAMPNRQASTAEAPRPIQTLSPRDAALRREAAARRTREQLCREGWHMGLAKALIGVLDKPRGERRASAGR